MSDEIIQRVNRVFSETFEIDPVKLTPEAKLFDDLGLDSLDAVDLVVSLKEECGVDLRKDPRVRKILTMNDVYKLVADVLAEKNAKA